MKSTLHSVGRQGRGWRRREEYRGIMPRYPLRDVLTLHGMGMESGEISEDLQQI